MQRDTLKVLKKSGKMTPTDAAKFWGITKQSAHERLAALVTLGAARVFAGVYEA